MTPSCPLTDKLPPELRDHIYAYLSIGTLDYPRLVVRNTWISVAPADATPILHVPVLARTCRVLRADVLRRYLGDLRVELSDSSELDGIFFERCLRALGSAVLHVRRLTIEHKVDICLDEDAHDVARLRATTVFEVTPSTPTTTTRKHTEPGHVGDDDDHRSPVQGTEPVTVTVSCDFKPSVVIGDEILPQPGSICDCPLTDRLSHATASSASPPHKANNNPSDAVAAAAAAAAACTPPSPSPLPFDMIYDCPLTRSVSSFLALLDLEASVPNHETRPRHHPGGPMYSPMGLRVPYAGVTLPTPFFTTSSPPTSPHDGPETKTARFWPWPVCQKCRRRRWLLQGPLTGAHYAENERRWRARAQLGGAERSSEFLVNYLGSVWILCPYDPVPRRPAGPGASPDADPGAAFRCRWGPTRPKLVRPYGQKSRRLL
ncbi:hypothetical protein MN608_08653 [Microdochium nivale]|nr:hypothetical protein MN608_08653 [Microdochium nivale]